MEKEQTNEQIRAEFYHRVETYLTNRNGFGPYLKQFYFKVGSSGKVKYNGMFKNFDSGMFTDSQLKKMINVTSAVIDFYENKPLYNPHTVDAIMPEDVNDNDPYSLALRFARMDFDILTRMLNARENARKEDYKRIKKLHYAE